MKVHADDVKKTHETTLTRHTPFPLISRCPRFSKGRKPIIFVNGRSSNSFKIGL